MTLHDLLVALVAAALVIVGVIAGSIADRIRGNRATVRRTRAQAHAPTDRLRSSPTTGAFFDNDTNLDMARDVITTLRTAGYDKRTAELAVAGCAPSQCATIESWTRAALKRAATKEGSPS